jgi:hypothetical protein
MWINGLVNFFNDDKKFMLYAINRQGVDLSVVSETLRNDPYLVHASQVIDEQVMRDSLERLKRI